ncbi:MAG: alpha/beta fold hydrolase [Candidatus Sericytochromatia bacterium]
MLEALEAQRQALRAQGVNETDLPFCLYQPDFRTGLLLLHGSAATPCNHRALGQHLLSWGYTVLAPLLAGHDRPARLNAGEVSWQDCYHSAAAALDQLSQVCERVFVVGSSFGGSLAYILGVERSEQISGLVAASAPVLSSDRWHPPNPWMQQVAGAISAAGSALPALRLPTLILHGHDDPSVKVKNAYSAFERIPALRKKLILYHGIGHAVGFGFNTPEVAEDIHQFIKSSTPTRQISVVLEDQGYAQVHLAGEFNAWSAYSLPMQRQGSHWHCDFALLPGVYQYKLVLSDYAGNQSWSLDPDAETVLTPHGEYNSLLRVI